LLLVQRGGGGGRCMSTNSFWLPLII